MGIFILNLAGVVSLPYRVLSTALGNDFRLLGNDKKGNSYTIKESIKIAKVGGI